MKNLLRQLIYFLQTLSGKQQQNTFYSHTEDTSKTFISSTEHLTFNAENEKLSKLVRTNMEDIFKKYKNEPSKLLEIIKEGGTDIVTVNNANKILEFIGETEGFITELKGLKALYINILIFRNFKTKTTPVFIMRKTTLNPVSLFHHFYKWYAFKSKLPGFDFKSQELFKRYMKYPNADLSKLTIEDTVKLQQAVARDKEATDFCLYIVRETEGAKNVKTKMADGGANI